MFNDPSAKVYAVFLETLPRFVTSHADDVPPDWIYVCLSRVLSRVSTEQFSSVLSRLNKVLKAVRSFSHFKQSAIFVTLSDFHFASAYFTTDSSCRTAPV